MKKNLILSSIFIIVVFFSTFPVSASSGFTVGHSGGKGISPEVVPGEIYNQTLVVSVGEANPATDVIIEVMGYADRAEASTVAIPIEIDNTPFSACEFIQPQKINLKVQPGETKQSNIQISIPQDVGSGGRYAILRFSTVPPGDGTVKTVSSIVLPLRFTIAGSQLVHTAEITGVNTGKAENGKPIGIDTVVKNTGNHHFRFRSEVEIRDVDGKLVDTVYALGTSPIPEGIKTIRSTYIPSGELPLGVYSVKSSIMLEDGKVLDEGTGSFEIGQPYIPPPPPASVILSPATASVLETRNKEISISFPKAAVTAQVEVSLRPYPPEQLPTVPEKFGLGSTCFRIDGLNGLLEHEASLFVKYSSHDLEKAGGNANLLRLARWDEANEKWDILKTSIDEKSSTLTASTDKFSIWVIMIAPPEDFNWLQLAAASAGGIVLIAGIYFWTAKRRRS